MIISEKKILVTGASGFIGSHLCRDLIKLKAQVYGVSRQEPKKLDSSIQWRQGDVSDSRFVDKLINKIRPQLIFHLASYVVGLRDLDAVRPTFHSNLLSAINLLVACTYTGCERIILIGSQEEPEDGGTQAIPSSPYAAAKWAASSYARMFHALYQTPVAIARIFMVYGPGQNDLQKLVPYVTLSVLRKESPKLTSGERQVDWIYVEDVVEGLIAMAQTKNIEGCKIELGSGKLRSIKDIVERLVRIIDREITPLFGNIADRQMEQIRVADIADTYEKIGWKPKISLEEGLERTVAWYKQQINKY